MEPVKGQSLGVDIKKLTEFLPQNHTAVERVISLANDYTWEQIQSDPEKGRAMMAELQKRVHECRDGIVDEITAVFFEEPYSKSLLAHGDEQNADIFLILKPPPGEWCG